MNAINWKRIKCLLFCPVQNANKNAKACVSSTHRPADLCQIGAFCFGCVEPALTGVCDLPFIKKTMTSSFLLALHATSDAAASVWIRGSRPNPNDVTRRGQTRQARFFVLFYGGGRTSGASRLSSEPTGSLQLGWSSILALHEQSAS